MIKVIKEKIQASDKRHEEANLSQENIHGFTVYTSPMRDELIKLCGWCPVVQSIIDSADPLIGKRKHQGDKELKQKQALIESA